VAVTVLHVLDGVAMPDKLNMPVRKTKAPSAIAKQPNGAVDESLLEVVDRPGILFKMAALPARGMRAMHAAIRRDLGITLSTTGRGRTLAGQWLIFGGDQARYRPCSPEEFNANHALGKELTKVFPAQDRVAVATLLPGVVIPESDHWTKIQFSNGSFPATAAVPGTSPHGLWCADDLALPDGSDKGNAPDNITDDVARWLFAHELDFGFAHGTTSEKWHVQWFVGDTVPPAVLAFEESDPLAQNFAETLTSKQSVTRKEEENDMVKAIKAADADAIFTASGIVASWVRDPDDYAIAVSAGLAPPLDKVETVDRKIFSALRLVGEIPPGFTAAEFQEVVDDHPSG
jgi:hypothetical protein